MDDLVLVRRALLVLAVLLLLIVAAGQAPAPSGPVAPPPATTQPAVPNILNIPSGSHVAVIRLEGEINSFTPTSIERRIARAIDGGASVIVLELDTPGGEVTAAMATSKYLKTVPVPTVAYVHNDAYSAGALLASACDEIVMSPASAIGDAAPISLFGDLAPTERAKILSPWLAEFRDNARANGYSYALFEAMCVLGIEVYEIRNPATGEVRFVNQADLKVMVEGEALQGVLRSTSRGVANPVTEKDILSATVEVATDADRGQWVLVRQVHDGQTLLTLNQTEAEAVQLSEATLPPTQIGQAMGAAMIAYVPLTWSERVASFLTQLWVRAVLIIVVLVCGYIEFQAPGVSGAGIVAGIALLALIGAPYLLGLAEVWHIFLILVGVLLLMVELFFTPSFGLLGILGLFAMFIGLVLMVIPTGGGPTFGPISLPPGVMLPRLAASAAATVIGLVGSAVGFYFVTRHFGRVPGLNRMILASEGLDATGEDAAGGAPPLMVDDFARLHVGDEGVAVTWLRPGGRAEIAGRDIDVVSQGAWIERGAALKIVAVEGNRIVVDELRPDSVSRSTETG